MPAIRPTARVLMLDDSDRVLLFRGQDPDQPDTRFWFPTGGGIEAGETPEEAARREVLEETGLADIDLGPHIWNRRHLFKFYGEYQDVRETWFFARVPAFTVETSGFTEVEKEVVKESHWWTIAELEKTTDVLTPRNLAALVQDLLLNGLPEEPMDVPV